jgi:hypothetical protein
MPLRARHLAAAALLLLPLAAVPGPATAAGIHMDLGDEDITLDDEDVLVTAEDGSRASISPEGDLVVRGRRVAVSATDRRALRHYNETVHGIVEQGIELGMQGAGLAFSALGEVVAALASGEPERAERRVERRAEPIKEAARELCKEVQALVLVQESIASRVPAFRPYAVMDEDAGEDCVEDVED